MDEGYSELGDLLRASREGQHITLDYASKQLHIRACYLKSIEAGKFSELPGSAYAKGYLQAYAQFLQLDKVEITRRYEQVEGPLARRSFFLPKVFDREKQVGGGAVTGGLLAAAIAYGIWVYALKPETVEISVVDTPMRMQEKMRISALKQGNVACLKGSGGLYPPCYMRKPEDGLLPLPRQPKTIMQLATDK
ncbi:MAG: helix-turn-helix domain-containing protein [Rickettsiales bacterium]